MLQKFSQGFYFEEFIESLSFEKYLFSPNNVYYPILKFRTNNDNLPNLLNDFQSVLSSSHFDCSNSISNFSQKQGRQVVIGRGDGHLEKKTSLVGANDTTLDMKRKSTTGNDPFCHIESRNSYSFSRLRWHFDVLNQQSDNSFIFYLVCLRLQSNNPRPLGSATSVRFSVGKGIPLYWRLGSNIGMKYTKFNQLNTYMFQLCFGR